MKRTELIRRLRKAAKAQATSFELERQGGEHEVWSFGDQQVAIPRHSEIKEQTARAILRKLGAG